MRAHATVASVVVEQASAWLLSHLDDANMIDLPAGQGGSGGERRRREPDAGGRHVCLLVIANGDPQKEDADIYIFSREKQCFNRIGLGILKAHSSGNCINMFFLEFR